MKTKRILFLFITFSISFSFRIISQNLENYELQFETGVATGVKESVGTYSFSLSPGYRINSRFVLGVGASYENYGEDHLLLDEREGLYKDTGRRLFWVPYAHGKYTFFSKKLITAYVKGRAGYGIYDEKEIPFKYKGLIFSHPKGGVNTSFYVGCTYPVFGKNRLSLAVSYHYQQLTNRYKELPWDYRQEENNTSIGINIGVIF